MTTPKCLWLLLPAIHCAMASGAETILPDKRLVTPEEFKFAALPDAPPGVLSAVPIGDTAKKSIYVLRNKFPPNTTLPPHSHSDSWRIATVLEGAIYFGYGNTIDEKSLKRLGPGSVIAEPKGVVHYFITKGEGAVINVVAEGPFTTTFVKKP